MIPFGDHWPGCSKNWPHPVQNFPTADNSELSKKHLWKRCDIILVYDVIVGTVVFHNLGTMCYFQQSNVTNLIEILKVDLFTKAILAVVKIINWAIHYFHKWNTTR